MAISMVASRKLRALLGSDPTAQDHLSNDNGPCMEIGVDSASTLLRSPRAKYESGEEVFVFHEPRRWLDRNLI